jgi:mannitol-1-phosphate/altronate dehydrogenase
VPHLTREQVVSYMIACCERYENRMNDNEILRAASGLIRKFTEGVLPTLRSYVDLHFEPPKNLSLTLAATILLYAGAHATYGGFEVTLSGAPVALHDNPEALSAFSLLSPNMPADSLAYAALADRALWNGADLREMDGLEALIAENLSMVRSTLV